MHDHDRELIAALAEDSLEPEAAAAARAEIESCAECSAELELQHTALAALGAAPPAGLTEWESAQLRRDLRRELGLSKPQAASAEPWWRRMPIAALATAAAVLIAVVIVGPGLQLIGGSSSDSDATIAADAAPTTTAAAMRAPETAAPPAFEAQAPPAAEGALEDAAAGADTTTAIEGATTTAAPATTGPTRPIDESLLYGFFSESPDLLTLRATIENSSFDEEESRSEILRVAGDSVLEEDPGDAAACIAVTISAAENYVEGYQVARGENEDGRAWILIVYLAEDPEESALIMHAADNCEELAAVIP